MIFPSSQFMQNDRKKGGIFVEDLCQLVHNQKIKIIDGVLCLNCIKGDCFVRWWLISELR